LACEQALLAQIVRLYGLRNWVEQSYKQMKDELGWADFIGPQGSRYSPPLGARVLRICFLLAACKLPFARQRRDAPTGLGRAVVKVAKK
jgi:hypothetical protein